MVKYYPEGYLIDTLENRSYLKSINTVMDAYKEGKVLEAKPIVCDSSHNLIVNLGCMTGIIPREDGAIGIREGTVKDIALISRVNKPVCFIVTDITTDEFGRPLAQLSRRAVQEKCSEEYLSQLVPGDIIDAKITHLENFGAFADIGAGVPSLIPIDSISVSRISHPSDRFEVGQDVKTVVKTIDENGRICLSHKELLGTWEENAAFFNQGETVAGVIRSVESYGIFVELAPNLAGLAEYKEGVKVGDQASVYIKNLIEEKMKVKLIIIDSFSADNDDRLPKHIHYFINSGHMDKWVYSPSSSTRVLETVFKDENQ